MEVPVNPVWPKLSFEKYLPLDEVSVGTFQPSVRAFFASGAGEVNCVTVSRRRIR
jgi:hypothetical protein